MTDADLRQPVQLSTYLWTYLTLCILATLSLLLARQQFPAALAIALVVAGIKALLVLGFFMHLAYERFSFKLIVLIASVMVALLVGLTAADPLSRSPYPPAPEQNVQYSPRAQRPLPTVRLPGR